MEVILFFTLGSACILGILSVIVLLCILYNDFTKED